MLQSESINLGRGPCFLFHAAAENEAASFPWSCSSLNGQCRNVCLPHEMFFGPLGCGKGFMCCVSHFL
uniref:Beta-defensin n=1 Tax=Oryzias sinensis TaxID=183150 RepID=A0A8C8E169_9TELE